MALRAQNPVRNTMDQRRAFSRSKTFLIQTADIQQRRKLMRIHICLQLVVLIGCFGDVQLRKQLDLKGQSDFRSGQHSIERARKDKQSLA